MVWQKGYKLQGGRYVIEKVLGEGGFGITYQAQHTLLKQWVVIKTPNEILKNDSEYPNYVKRFIQEGRKLAQLSQQPHPNIVRVTELFEDSKTYCLVMDFVPGESLFNLVQKQGALPELEAVGYIKQIGEALIFVHHQGLVHRDAHPGNIMVQKNGKAVLIDFGIAGEIMPQDGYFTSHHPANIAFAPYEQMGGNRQVTIDVYTLAASLYYAVTGKRPESSLDRKLYNKPLIPPNKYIVGISNELNLAILKGMNLEAENRPQSMRQWLKLLPDFSNQVYQVSQKIEHQTIKTEKTFPVIVGANNSLKARVKINNIPCLQLGCIGFYHLVCGFLFGSFSTNPKNDLAKLIITIIIFPSMVSGGSQYDADKTVRLVVIFGLVSIWGVCPVSFSSNLHHIFSESILTGMFFSFPTGLFVPLSWLMTKHYGWSSALPIPISLAIFLLFTVVAASQSWTTVFAYIGVCIFNILLSLIYIYANEELAKSFRKWHQFLIILATSWLSIFLGWLLYQFFPIFANG
ncbi:serine/threonine-protein kinase [Dolichospermum sp. LEGE 00246]|uniref:serine/threonine protein kinase n=1 Tax=Dolichospermum sp. LEGE 00246 TaxID=1828605 RepID=UPI00187EA554|nr:serine/threonine-protein kinase [Dolichospermum sp. LEGE 00246]MBE9256911.1 serine/threonine protein kinase [Dolichospermum sp. LEGE 00246]